LQPLDCIRLSCTGGLQQITLAHQSIEGWHTPRRRFADMARSHHDADEKADVAIRAFAYVRLRIKVIPAHSVANTRAPHASRAPQT
jgi:hypothetical protein